MRIFIRLIPITILFFYSFSVQSQSLPNTLLWKISGNGLTRPSYLYGTMHLTDERIFELGDSLYNAIEQTDGFAMEVNPEEMTSLVVDELNKKLNDGRLLKNMIEEEKFKQYKTALSKKFNKPADEITSQDILKEKNKWIEESYRDGKMSTALDAYLYDIARRQGKWVGGIEDMIDQSGLIDDLIDEDDIKRAASEGGDKRSVLYMEAMIQYYLSANLNAIDSISNFGDSTYIDALLIKRNVKMATRMDSLSSLRSMTFAVGAAHLPGKKGLIQLLKSKGFTVQPVFYSKQIPPEKYIVKEVEIPWVNVSDSKGYYTAQMPGKAGDITMFGIMEMKMYFDIFSSAGFFTTSMATPYGDDKIDSVINVVASNFFTKENAKKGKPILINGIKGSEWNVDGKDGYKHGYILYKNNVLYMALGYAVKKSDKTEKELKRFLSSYKPLENSVYKAEPILYVDTALAFSVEIPSKATTSSSMKNNKGENGMRSRMHVSIDNKTGSYYVFGVNEVVSGYHIENDSSTIENIRTNIHAQIEKITLDTVYTKDNNRVFEYAGKTQQGFDMKTYYQFRGNRWYALVAIYNSNGKDGFVNRFFSSFKLLNYPEQKWERSTTDDGAVSAWVPDILTSKQDSGSSNTSITYTSFDSVRADSYYIFDESFDKYYWQTSDSTFWESFVKHYVKYNDTLLNKTFIYNGRQKGMELLTQEKNANNVTRRRIWPFGNKVYVLLSVQPLQNIRSSNTNKFFEEVVFNKPVVDDNFIFTSKAEKLIADLSSKDSATRSAAMAALPSAGFTKVDATLLNNALLKKYEGDEDDAETIKEGILSHIVNIQDSSSLVFAKNKYKSAGDDKSILLDLISFYKTTGNYREMKDLILSSPPRKQLNYDFTDNLDDSLSLTNEIIRPLLPLYSDTVFAEALIGVTNKLLDSNYLSLSEVKAYQPQILKYADHRYTVLKADAADYSYIDARLIILIGKLKTAQANAMLQKWLNLSELYLVSNAFDELLLNKQTIPSKAILKLASSNDYRLSCYDALKENKKASLFPKQYLTQKYFAESLLYGYANDDYETSSIKFHSQKTILFSGKKKTVYFFKVGYKEDEKESFYLAGVGPFNIKTTDMNVDDAMEYMHNEEYDAEKATQQISDIVDRLQKWERGEEEE